MNIVPTQTVAPATDDQELAKVLESMNNSLTGSTGVTQSQGTSNAATIPAPVSDTTNSPQFQSSSFSLPTPVTDITPAPVSEPPFASAETVVPVPTPVSNFTPVQTPTVPVAPDNGELESIKKDALTELRPLVGKLNLSPEDTFDTLMLLIHSGNDKTLISQAHDAARGIEDESRRAEALLDVIKEIDYFSHLA